MLARIALGLTVALGFWGAAEAQIVRSGGSGLVRVRQPASGAPVYGAGSAPSSSGIRVSRPARPSTSLPGNVVAPGTPGSVSRGSITSPGIPGGTVGRTSSVSTPGSAARRTAPREVRTPAPASIQPAPQRTGGVPVHYGYGAQGVIAVPYPVYYPEYAGDTSVAAVDGYDATAPDVEFGPLRPEDAVEPEEEADGDDAAEVEPAAEAKILEITADEGPRPVYDRDAPFHLIALKSGNIYAASEHWLEGETLHYMTRDGHHNLASLAEVDLEFTAQLNNERGLVFAMEVRR